MRETSLEAYQEIRDQGLLSARRMEVYEILFHQGPLTDQEVASRMEGEGNRANGMNSGARLNELRAMGCVKEVGTTVSKTTGMTVIVWDVTRDLPKKLDKSKVSDTRKHLTKCKEVLKEIYLHKDLPESLRQLVKQKFSSAC